MNKHNTRAIVLAAGRSTRFKTKKSKLLFDICGQPMLLYPLKALEALSIPISLVLGYQADQVKDAIAESGIANISYVIQDEQCGTGHAVSCTQETWDNEDILILYGDQPLLTQELLDNLITEHQEKKSTVTFLKSYMLDPGMYGRVLEEDGHFEIIEAKDCSPDQLHINQVNAGVYVIKKDFLTQYLPKLEKSGVTGEVYLPGLIKMACDLDLIVHAISVPYDNIRGVNTLQDLWGVEQIRRSEYIKHWMSNGVRFELAQNIHIDKDVIIGSGTYIGSGVHLFGKTSIGENCQIDVFSVIENSTIADDTRIHSHSVIQDSIIGSNVEVGPFARLRGNTVVKDNVQIGNFVEVKNSQLSEEVRVKHLTYLGDTEVGSSVNVGAGTVTCNYDGNKKSTTIIEKNVFIGSNNTLIAPVTIKKGSYTAAGSVITKDVPADALAIARSRQINKEGYAKKLKKETEDQQKEHIEKTDFFDDNDDSDFQFRGAVKTKVNEKKGF